MDEWVVEKDAGNRDHRKDVENGEKFDGLSEKCCDAGRGNVQVSWYFTTSCTGMYTITQSI